MLAVAVWLAFACEMGQAAEKAESLPAFEAEVIGARPFAHSGPGIEFYPTQLLKRGDRVTVYAVKNGWAAIAPPKGSFSWVPADAVLEEEDGTGRITADNVKLRVGSALSDGHHVFQIALNKGDKVTIFSREPLRDINKSTEWFKVRPHRDELRYMAAADLNLPTLYTSKVPDAAVTPSAGWNDSSKTTARSNPGSAANQLPLPAATAKGVDAGRGSVLTPANAAQPLDPPVRPANGRMIPSAQPLNRLTGLRNAAASESTDPAAPPLAIVDDRMAPFERRMQSLRSQLEIMRAREPAHWNLPSAEKMLDDLKTAARSDAEKDAVAETRAVVRKMGETQERYTRSIKRFDSALQRDQELASQQISRQSELGRLSRRFTAEGTIRRSAISVGDLPTMKIENAAGEVTHYAISPNGLNLEKYIGKRVGLLGPATRRANLPIPVVEVEQVMPAE